MSDSHENALAEMLAYHAVRRLQNRYADIVTRRAWAELHDLMRPNCTVTVDLVDRSIDFDGPQAIGDFIGTQLRQFDFFEFVILNTVMTISDDASAAAARMYIQEARQDIDGGTRSDTFGVYHDRFDRDVDGRWWFARRQYQSYARTNPDGSDGTDARDLVVFDLPDRDLDQLD